MKLDGPGFRNVTTSVMWDGRPDWWRARRSHSSGATRSGAIGHEVEAPAQPGGPNIDGSHDAAAGLDGAVAASAHIAGSPSPTVSGNSLTLSASVA
jgi:hypothetical protein